MANERLRAALLSNGFGIQEASANLGVDRKTVERWISGRVPYRKHQYALAAMLGVDLSYLWPDSRSGDEINALGQAEVVAFYAHRSVVPVDEWMTMFDQARSNLDVLVFSAFWLSELSAFHRLLRDKAKAGLAIRIMLGEPSCSEVTQRGTDEGIGAAMANKVRNAIVNYGDLPTLDGIEFRLHGTTLYNSLYRADDEMLVNTHIYGVGAYLAPVLHLQRVPGADLFTTYLDCFERVWSSARPLTEADRTLVA
ncbi:MAG: helix-turn-helix domain-containing protein [Acidimicrobiales bacterium]